MIDGRTVPGSTAAQIPRYGEERQMRNLKAEMFNRKAADPKNKPDEILRVLGLGPGQSVADIGCGGGYFSLRFADLVGGEGRVYAVDTREEFLQFCADTARERGLHNIVTVLATEGSLPIPEGSLDLVFIRNAYHHLENRVDYFRNLKRLLKPEGTLAIVEYRRGRFFSFHRIFGHYVPQESIVEEMVEAGYRLKGRFDFLVEQSFTLFSR